MDARRIPLVAPSDAAFRAFVPRPGFGAAVERAWLRLRTALRRGREVLEGRPHPTLVGLAPLSNFSHPSVGRASNWRWAFAVVTHAVVLVGVLVFAPSSAPVVEPPSIPVLFYPAPKLPEPVVIPEEAPPPPPPPKASPRSKRVVAPVPQQQPVVAPEVTQPVAIAPEPAATEESSNAPASDGDGVEGGVAGGVKGGVVGGTGKAPAPAKPVAVKAVKKVGAVQPARVMTRVDPVYPPEAKAARLEGRVMLMVVVGVDGRVTDVKVLSGPPLLARAAAAAVAQWVYTPGKDGDGRVAVSQVLTPMDFKLQ